MAPLKITIVGGGIGGLTAAQALRKDGHDIIVLEKSLLKREIGAAISLGSQVSRILRNIGFDFKKARAEVCDGFAVLTADGEGKMVAGLDCNEVFGEHWYTIHRVDMHNELRRLVTDESLPGPPVDLRLGASVESIDAEEGIVTLVGGEVIQSDVIIGADGIHSITRQYVAGPDSKPKPQGYAVYRTLIPVESIMADPELALVFGEPWCKIWIGDNGNRIVAYWARDHQFLNCANVVNEKGLAATDDYEGVGEVSDMVNHFADFAPYIPRMLRLAPSVGVWKLRDHEQLDTWVKGRCIVIGDAAHALMPHEAQGASQSIEDAEAVGAYLAPFTETGTSGTEINGVLELISALRKPRAHSAQAQSRDGRAPWHKHPEAFAQMEQDARDVAAGLKEPPPPPSKDNLPAFGWQWYMYKGILEHAKEKGFPLPKGMTEIPAPTRA